MPVRGNQLSAGAVMVDEPKHDYSLVDMDVTSRLESATVTITHIYKCPFCTRQWERLLGDTKTILGAIKHHVRAMHPLEYHKWLLNVGLRGKTKAEKHADHIERLRNDPDLTAARYDEIVKLRMLLLDILDDLKDDWGEYALGAKNMAGRIEHFAKTWGKKGDCV